MDQEMGNEASRGEKWTEKWETRRNLRQEMGEKWETRQNSKQEMGVNGKQDKTRYIIVQRGNVSKIMTPARDRKQCILNCWGLYWAAGDRQDSSSETIANSLCFTVEIGASDHFACTGAM